MLKDYRRKLKDFQKTTKRRHKFFEKDLIDPINKEYGKRKSLSSELKKKSTSW